MEKKNYSLVINNAKQNNDSNSSKNTAHNKKNTPNIITKTTTKQEKTTTIKHYEKQYLKHKKTNSISTRYSGRTLDVLATRYTALCNTGCTGITATGIDIRNTIYYHGYRIIATDPSVIPLYSLVHVSTGNGSGFDAISLDTGGMIRGNHIDILTDSRQKALSYGSQHYTVTVIREGRG